MMKLITEELLDTVTSRAKENSRLRMNYNFHASMDAPIHRLLNALEPGTYLPPHRHTGKEETYLVLRGSLLAFFYDDAGNVTDKVCLNPSEGKYGLEIRHYKIFCVNVKYGIQYGFRIFYLIALQNEENYEREESCSA